VSWRFSIHCPGCLEEYIPPIKDLRKWRRNLTRAREVIRSKKAFGKPSLYPNYKNGKINKLLLEKIR